MKRMPLNYQDTWPVCKLFAEIEYYWPTMASKFDPAKMEAALETVESKWAEARDRLRPYLISEVDGVPNVTNVYIGHSGGKDSCVVMALAHEINDTIPVVHTAKIGHWVHQLTRDFIYETIAVTRGLIMCPLDKQEQTLKQYGWRFQIDGTRACEAERSDGRSTDLVINGENVNRKGMGFYNESGLFNLSFLYPIYDWTDHEVWAAIFKKGIPFSFEYPSSPGSWVVLN